MSALVSAVLATALAVAVPLGEEAHRPADGAAAVVDLGVEECAWDVNDRGVVVTTTHVVRDGHVLGLPGGLTSARFVNDRGQVAGEVDGRAAFWDGRRLWLVGTLSPDHVLSYVTGLSERGELVGTSSAPGGEPAAFRWRRGVMTPLVGLGGRTDANDVNDRGQVVGAAWLDGTQHAVRWEADGRLVRLPGLGDGSGSSLATAVDSDGRAAGYSYVAAGTADMRPVRWSRSGAVTDVGPGGGALGLVADLNDRGRAIGSISMPGAGQQAFVQDRGATMRLVPTGAGTTILTAVNGGGLAAGCVLTDDGERAVLWR
ncbi:hypothetical protein [Cellulomonas shaoxiangyii]|uniref:HAF repeat-containing protein n=1 Tax=Cellulomonas shaoxiangyii TaxID=2566013 RepID=A0A4P7SGA4_9CELL|nr:hypothetical protein [Cellulomonas shaoxiangyii]QCB92992.1 hypothetical protein E5225_04905 [Cellulomonas shaoxiangyii]TGY85591.1 hypothetical protein E5226_06050 [Cellulomonas shaoxiangyii]